MKRSYRITSEMKAGAVVLALVTQLVSAQDCTTSFGGRIDKGVIAPDITEASGLAASRLNANVLYTHEDSGHSSKVFMMNSSGAHLGYIRVENYTARDWEDIAVGPGPDDGASYLYVGDIGDNSAQYPTKTIIRFREPSVSASQAAANQYVSSYDLITFQYPDGARDAETLMVDPLTKDIFVVSKREANVNVYRLPYPQSTTQVITAQKVLTLGLTSTVAGDISVSGYQILIKDYGQVYKWCRAAGQTIAQALASSPVVVPYVAEQQGESVCWSASGDGYFTVSEGTSQHLSFYPAQGSVSTPPPGPAPEPDPTPTPAPAPTPSSYRKHDYSGDGKADISVFFGKGRTWYTINSASGAGSQEVWGDTSAAPAPGDFDGDGSADLATFNPPTGLWRLNMGGGDTLSVQFGWSETVSVAADYDGDGVSDIAVFHPASGTWYIMKTTAGFQTHQFGWSEVTPVPADFDGDGKDDLAVFYPAQGAWHILQSRDGYRYEQFGWGETVACPADYDGDGKADLAVYHPATGGWYIHGSKTGPYYKQFGWSETLPVPADFDGDHKDDLAVYHPAAGTWYAFQSAEGFKSQTWGWSETDPVASDSVLRTKYGKYTPPAPAPAPTKKPRK